MSDTSGARRRSPVLLTLAVAPWLCAAEAAAQPTVAGAPLILQDGRIADVSVATLPFDLGEASLAPAAAEALRRRVGPLATDCFLAAQVIGHVQPGSQADGDTLAAHRLARHRAEHVQALLVEAGLPVDFVTTAWDWQFLLAESRVTLWLFTLVSEDDCAGTRLAAASTSRTASPPVPVGAARFADVEEPLPVAEPVGDPASEHAVEHAVEAMDAGVVEDAGTEPAAPGEGEVVVLEGAEIEIVTVEDEPAEPIQDIEPLPEMLVAEPDHVVASLPPASDGPAHDESADDEDPVGVETALAELAIVFDVNSSFFSPQNAAELRRFLAVLPTETEVVVELAGAVGTGPVRGASADGAEEYHRWMAERRLERVATWLAQRARDRGLVLEQRLVEGDDSRSVMLRARPPS